MAASSTLWADLWPVCLINVWLGVWIAAVLLLEPSVNTVTAPEMGWLFNIEGKIKEADFANCMSLSAG